MPDAIDALWWACPRCSYNFPQHSVDAPVPSCPHDGSKLVFTNHRREAAITLVPPPAEDQERADREAIRRIYNRWRLYRRMLATDTPTVILERQRVLITEAIERALFATDTWVNRCPDDEPPSDQQGSST